MVLAFIAVNGSRRKSVLVQTPGDFVCAVLGAGKDDCALVSGFAKNIDQQRGLGPFGDIDDALVDPFNRLRVRRHCNFNRIVQEVARQSADLFRHCRREQGGAALARQIGHDLANGRQETKIEHLVCLIENNRGRLVDPDDACGHVIEQTARRRHQNINAIGHRPHLRVRLDPANNHSAAMFDMLAIDSDIIGNLCRKLAGRRNDQGFAAAFFQRRCAGRNFIE